MSNEKKKQKKTNKNNLSNIVKESTEISSMSFSNGKRKPHSSFPGLCIKKKPKAKNQTKELDGYDQFHALLKRTSKTT